MSCRLLARSLLQSLYPSILASLSPSPQRKPNHASRPTTPTLLAEYPTTGSQCSPDKEPPPRAYEALQPGPAPPPASPHAMFPPALPAPAIGFAFESHPLLPLGFRTSLCLGHFLSSLPYLIPIHSFLLRYKDHKVHLSIQLHISLQVYKHVSPSQI